MKISVLLLFVTFTLAYCQPDKTFTEVVTFEKGLRFNVSGEIQLLPYLGGSGGVVNWTDVLNKPLVFTPDLSITNLLYKPISYTPTYAELPDKPGEVELQEAISQLSGIKLPVLTTVQIDALTTEAGTLVYDATLNVLKINTGNLWKILITNQ